MKTYKFGTGYVIHLSDTELNTLRRVLKASGRPLMVAELEPQPKPKTVLRSTVFDGDAS